MNLKILLKLEVFFEYNRDSLLVSWIVFPIDPYIAITLVHYYALRFEVTINMLETVEMS